MPEEKTEEKCDKCGKPMVIKTGRFGKFLACSGFPDCKNVKPVDKEERKEKEKQDKEVEKLKEKYKDEKCDKCGSAMIIKNGKYGPFLACSNFPKCRNINSIKENNNNSTGIKCPKCKKGDIIAKKGRRGIFYACNRYPDCKTAFWSKPTGDKCPECDSLLVEGKEGEVKCSNKECKYKTNK